MAEGSDVDLEPDWSNRLFNAEEDTFVAMESLTLATTLRSLEADLREQPISEISSTEYCDNFCQALMHYAGSMNSVEHGLPLLEMYCLSISCFASARPQLTAESESVPLVLKRLALSCFELLLSVPENQLPFETWLQFHHSVQESHDALLAYGSTDLQVLLQITGEGGAWNNPVLTALLTGQHTSTEEVDGHIALEGEAFMEMRVKHLEKMGEVAKAVVLAKACSECCLISNQASFRQTYVSLLCQLLPNEEAINEISRLNCKDVLDITCNLETEGDDNSAFILCTTYLTQQLQQRSLFCSWELTQLWSRLQRRTDPSLESLLTRCLQLGAIAKTACHLLFLVRVIMAEAGPLGLAASVELCVGALQLPKEDDDTEDRISICKTISCLLPDDLDVLRACQLTEFLLGPSHASFCILQELHQRPDPVRLDLENGAIPNSLRCELFLVLKAHWPFDPEFWDWKMLRHHCVTLLGLDPEEGENEEEEERGGGEQEGESSGQGVKVEGGGGTLDFTREFFNGLKAVDGCEEYHQGDERKFKVEKGDQGSDRKSRVEKGDQGDKKSKVVKEPKSKKHKFSCKICKKAVVETRILHHSKRHVQDGVYTCPVCLETFPSRKDLINHTKKHLPTALKKKKKKKLELEELLDDDDSDDLEPGEIAGVDPSLMLYYQSTQDPVVLEHIREQAKTATIKPGDEEHVTFTYINSHFELQNRDLYPCPGTHCTKVFKNSKYLGVHLIKKGTHAGDENVKHYFEMKNRREKCPYCRRHLMSAYHMRKHRRVHVGDEPYICVVAGCGARFQTTNDLITHRHSHGVQLRYECELPGCTSSFCDLGMLYHHEAQHFWDAAYTCTSSDCKKYYLSKKEFIKHLSTHGIIFTDEDFEARREAKRRFLDPKGEGKRPTLEEVGDRKSVREGTVYDSFATAAAYSTSSASTSHGWVSKEPKATVTAVAVCFDGKRFTCGFERCGMSFSRARDVQRHLKAAHPEHLKSENKEHKKHDKERGPKSKEPPVKSEPNTENTSQNELSPSKPSQEKTFPSQVTHNTTALSSPAVARDPFREILLGLSQLSLDESCEPSRLSPVRTPPQSLHQTLMARSPVVLLQKGTPPVVGERVKVTESELLDLPVGTDNVSPLLAQANTKPYVCEVEDCGFRSVTTNTLMRHYSSKHKFDQEKAKSKLNALTLRPFVCHLCSKTYRAKSDLKGHYVQMHKLSAEIVDHMSYSKNGKLTLGNTRKHKFLPKPIPEHSTNDVIKVEKKEEESGVENLVGEQRFQKSKQGMSKREWGLGKSGENQRKHGQPPSSVIKVEKKEEESGVENLVEEQRFQKSKQGMLKREWGLGKSGENQRKHGQPPSSVQEVCGVQEEQGEGLDKDGEKVEEVKAERQGKGSDNGVSKETNGTDCLEAQKDLCYILTKFKSFDCENTDCGASFPSQAGLLQHLKVMHRYNHSPPSPEKGLPQKYEIKKETTKGSTKIWMPQRSRTPSDEPQKQYRCTYGKCTSSYHLKSSLMRHMNHEHREPHIPSEGLRCQYASCSRVFSHSQKLEKHVLYTHCKYIDSVVVRLQSTHKKDKSVNGCQKKLIVPKSLQADTDPPQRPHRQFLKRICKSDQNSAFEEIGDDMSQPDDIQSKLEDNQAATEEDTESTPHTRVQFEDMIFRSHEEALQMCQDRSLRLVYPCMVQGCDSVVKIFSSMRRHYLTCHHMDSSSYAAHHEKLVFNAEQLDELIQKKSALSAMPDLMLSNDVSDDDRPDRMRTPDDISDGPRPNTTRTPNGVLKMEYQAESEGPGGPSDMIHFIKTERLDTRSPPDVAEESPAERNVLVIVDDLPEGAQNSLARVGRRRLRVRNPPPTPPPPVTVNLSPPATLRFSTDEGCLDTSCNRPTNTAPVPTAPSPESRTPSPESCALSPMPTAPSPVPTAPSRQPLKRKNERPDPSTSKEPLPVVSTPRPRQTVVAFKPLNFETAFLQFIQETDEKNDKIKRPKPRPTQCAFRRICDFSVKENSQNGHAHARNKPIHSVPLKSPPMTRDSTRPVQNKRSILDKAKTECDDLAVKQLQYLKPVVVLERPMPSSPQLEVFPTGSNELLLGC